MIDLADGKASIVGAVPFGYVYVDGSSVGGITEAELKDRRILGDEGFVTISAVVSSADGSVLAGPQIHARGVAEEDSVFDQVLPEVTAALQAAVVGGQSVRGPRLHALFLASQGSYPRGVSVSLPPRNGM